MSRDTEQSPKFGGETVMTMTIALHLHAIFRMHVKTEVLIIPYPVFIFFFGESTCQMHACTHDVLQFNTKKKTKKKEKKRRSTFYPLRCLASYFFNAWSPKSFTCSACHTRLNQNSANTGNQIDLSYLTSGLMTSLYAKD